MSVSLLISTGSDTADIILIDVIKKLQGRFEERIKSIYVTGSYSTGGWNPTSDLDFSVVFSGELEAGEEEKAKYLIESHNQASAIRLDPILRSEHFLKKKGDVTIKLCSLLIYGQDIREGLPLPSLEHWTGNRMAASYNVIMRVRGFVPQRDRYLYPLDYPDPGGEFFGYDAGGLKELTMVTGWPATAMVALKAGVIVPSKDHCLALYRKHIGDEWTNFLQDVFKKLRRDWRYEVPTDPDGRRQLRSLCSCTLEFENHFLAVLKDYILSDLQAGRPSKLYWIRRLSELVFADPRVLHVVELYEADPKEKVRAAASEAARVTRAAIGRVA